MYFFESFSCLFTNLKNVIGCFIESLFVLVHCETKRYAANKILIAIYYATYNSPCCVLNEFRYINGFLVGWLEFVLTKNRLCKVMFGNKTNSLGSNKSKKYCKVSKDGKYPQGLFLASLNLK